MSTGIMNVMKCSRKVPHITRAEANEEAKRLTARSGRLFGCYRCTRGRACLMWHVATMKNIVRYENGE